MATLKLLLTYMLMGTLLGLAVASWLGPEYLIWDNTTGLTAQMTVNCNLPETIRNVADRLLYYQGVGAGVGAGVFLVLGLFVLRSRALKRRAQQGSAPGSSQPPAAQ